MLIPADDETTQVDDNTGTTPVILTLIDFEQDPQKKRANNPCKTVKSSNIGLPCRETINGANTSAMGAIMSANTGKQNRNKDKFAPHPRRTQTLYPFTRP